MRRWSRLALLLLPAAVLALVALGVWWYVGSDSVAALRSIGDDDLDEDVGAATDQVLDAAAISIVAADATGEAG